MIAILFFSFWGGVGSLVVWATRESPPAPTPTPRAAKPLEVASTAVLPTADGHADIIGLVKNPNGDAGASRVRYQFTIRVEGSAVRTIDGETYILPGRQKYVAAFNEEVPPGPASAELTVEQPAWTFVGSDFRNPALVLVNRSQRVLPGNPDIFEMKGLLANEGDVDYLRVEVTAVGLDARGEIVGIGYTFLGSLLALERREFTAQWPLPKGTEVTQILVLPDVNIFRADAVQQRQGTLDIRDAPRGTLVSPAP